MTDYATTQQVKDRIGKTRPDQDANIAALITGASDMIDAYCNRPDGFVAPASGTARLFTGRGMPYILIDEFVAVSVVEVKDSPTDDTYTTWSADDYLPFAGGPEDPNFNLTPYNGLLVTATGTYDTFTSGRFTHRGGFRPSQVARRGVPTVRVTARWGYATTTPPEVREACIAQVARWLKRAEAGWADAIASAEFEQLRFGAELDQVIKNMLVRLRKASV